MIRSPLVFLLLFSCAVGAEEAARPAPAPSPEATAKPPVLKEEVSVVASRFSLPIGDAPGSVTALGREELGLAVAPALDETLRQVPGFSLFRRTGSRTANPTTQGVSLRGVGASGASRAVVVCDGVPLNDAFGGWVYWGRVPRAAIERVEILRGGGSDLYGSGALGGVVRLFRREPEGRAARIEASLGSQETPEATVFLRTRRGRWSITGSGQYFRTDGYVLVGEADRGRIDVKAGSRHGSADLSVERRLGTAGRAFARASYFDERRQNGTPLQENDTQLRQLTAGLDAPAARGRLTLRAFSVDQDYGQSFSAVDADRNGERLTRAQAVASRGSGASIEWTRAVPRHQVVAGLEMRQLEGGNDEVAFSAASSFPSSVHGRQRLGALFAEDRWTLGARTTATVGLRLDGWRNADAQRTSGGSTTTLEPRSESAFSPRVVLAHEISAAVSVLASGYRAFRAPTLNELYRSFRVGNVLTAANETLEAERLTGIEFSVRLQPVSSPFSSRATAFLMEVGDAVANVTLSATPSLVERQRQNLGRTRSKGIEVDARWRLSPAVSLAAGYLLNDARVARFPADPTLEDRFLPQVARHYATVAAHVRHRSAQVSLVARYVGRQYDDDQNQLPLAPFATFDVRLQRPLFRRLSLFAAAENLLDERYEAGRTPARTLGPPRALRVGLTLDAQDP